MSRGLGSALAGTPLGRRGRRSVLAALLGPGAVLLSLALSAGAALKAETFRLATYNLENYLETATDNRPAKSAAARAKIRECILALKADVLAVQEIGPTNVLVDLCASLEKEGLAYPYWEHVRGHDPNIFVAVLSRFPIIARRPHTNETFLLQGRRFGCSRGFAEVDIRVSSSYTFTLITAHLKSRRPVPSAEEAELREQEALLLREKINTCLAANPQANLVVLGDLNDVRDSRAVRTVIGRGQTGLIDTRPAERNGDDQPNPNPRFEPRNITWTHHYGKEDDLDII